MTNTKSFTTETQRHREKTGVRHVLLTQSLSGYHRIYKLMLFCLSLMKLLAIRLRLATAPAKSLVMFLCVSVSLW